ncbi:nucleotidyltransferase family protein [Candidatus Peregrinibacteria bacterium]|nr:nucleotidyltransferase family protein [Candidatus Peregrinibacteria bacterium]
MQAVILSAGLGTRLRPLTDIMPKPMIPIDGKPMLEQNILRFKKFGVREFFINLHYLPDAIKSYFGDGSKLGVKIRYSLESEILGTAGGLKKFEPHLDTNFFLMYGDILSLVNYIKLYDFSTMKSDVIGVQRVGKTSYRADADLVELDNNKKFVAVHAKGEPEKQIDYYAMRGIFILNKRIMKYIPENTYYEIGKQLIPDVMKRGEAFYGYECDEYSKGIDTMDKYKEAEEYYKKHKEG